MIFAMVAADEDDRGRMSLPVTLACGYRCGYRLLNAGVGVRGFYEAARVAKSRRFSRKLSRLLRHVREFKTAAATGRW
jgi:hypothetical protein